MSIIQNPHERFNPDVPTLRFVPANPHANTEAEQKEHFVIEKPGGAIWNSPDWALRNINKGEVRKIPTESLPKNMKPHDGNFLVFTTKDGKTTLAQAEDKNKPAEPSEPKLLDPDESGDQQEDMQKQSQSKPEKKNQPPKSAEKKGNPQKDVNDEGKESKPPAKPSKKTDDVVFESQAKQASRLDHMLRRISSIISAKF